VNKDGGVSKNSKKENLFSQDNLEQQGYLVELMIEHSKLLQAVQDDYFTNSSSSGYTCNKVSFFIITSSFC